MSSVAQSLFLNPVDLFRLRSLAKRFPRETYRGIGRAGSMLRGKMRKVMRKGGGIEGVKQFAPLSEVTLQARRKGKKGRVSKKAGGQLAKASSIQMFRTGKGRFQVGFISALEALATIFQTAEQRAMEPKEKRWLSLAAGIRGVQLYNRPARDLVRSMGPKAARDLTRNALEQTKKILKKAAKK